MSLAHYIFHIESDGELEVSIDIRTPIAGLEKLGAKASIEYKSPGEFDFQVCQNFHRYVFRDLQNTQYILVISFNIEVMKI